MFTPHRNTGRITLTKEHIIMARQNRSTSKTADTSTEAVAPEAQEANMSENPIPEAEVTPTPEAKPDEKPVDLTEFEAVTAEALAEADSTTGQVPEGSIAKVNAAYRVLDGNKGKRAARDFLQESMLEAVGRLDAVAARGYSDLTGHLTAAGGAKAEKAPADPTAAFVQRRASLELALQIVNTHAPEGVEGLDEKVSAVVAENVELVNTKLAYDASEAEDKGEAPELNPVVRAAFKAASGKATGSRTSSSNTSGVRRDIGKHILSAFADLEVGAFLKISEIAAHKSAEYGDDSPSQGAISARLFPTTTLEGVEPVEAGALGDNKKGARKTA